MVWVCTLCQGIDGVHESDCEVARIIDDLRQATNDAQGYPTGALDEALVYHQHIVRKVMVQMGYDTGQIVKATMSCQCRYADPDETQIEWAASLPPQVAMYIADAANR